MREIRTGTGRTPEHDLLVVELLASIALDERPPAPQRGVVLIRASANRN